MQARIRILLTHPHINPEHEEKTVLFHRKNFGEGYTLGGNAQDLSGRIGL